VKSTAVDGATKRSKDTIEKRIVTLNIMELLASRDIAALSPQEIAVIGPCESAL
jgi:hypothetical protein